MRHFASRLGAALGNWNDRHAHHDMRSQATLRWRVLDAISSWLYVRPDVPKRRLR